MCSREPCCCARDCSEPHKWCEAKVQQTQGGGLANPACCSAARSSRLSIPMHSSRFGQICSWFQMLHGRPFRGCQATGSLRIARCIKDAPPIQCCFCCQIKPPQQAAVQLRVWADIYMCLVCYEAYSQQEGDACKQEGPNNIHCYVVTHLISMQPAAYAKDSTGRCSMYGASMCSLAPGKQPASIAAGTRPAVQTGKYPAAR